MKCPKCKGEMEKGFMADKGSWGTVLSETQKWVSRIGFLGTEQNPKEVFAFRCKNCGYLESYAK